MRHCFCAKLVFLFERGPPSSLVDTHARYITHGRSLMRQQSTTKTDVNLNNTRMNMTSLTQSRVLAVGGVYWYESILNDRCRRVVKKGGLDLWVDKSMHLVKKYSYQREQVSCMYIYLHAQLMTQKKSDYLISRGDGGSLRLQTTKCWAGSTNEAKRGPGPHQMTQKHTRSFTCNPMAFWYWSSVMLTCRSC